MGVAREEELLEKIAAATGAMLTSAVAYNLLVNASATGAPVAAIRGGDYVWRTEGTFGGATATLQYLGLDGVTYIDALDVNGNPAAVTAAAAPAVGIGQGATVRVKLAGGTPSAMNSNIAGIG